MWLLKLFMPLRGRYSGDVPIPHGAIISYLKMKGYDPHELYDWIVIADNAFLEWLGEQRAKERKELEQKSQNARHSIRH